MTEPLAALEKPAIGSIGWGEKLNQNADKIETFSSGVADTLASLESQSANAEGGLHFSQPLDIWDAFAADGTSAPNSWDCSTYANWIAGIDANLGATATKTTAGVASGGATVYAYIAGNVAGPAVFLSAGNHPWESLGQFAAMRYFEQFAKGTSPAMKALREQVRIVWVPTLTPANFRTQRTNANGVNINRNFPFFWDYYVEAASGTENAKGTAPFSEPESQLIKTLIDTHKVSCVVDCHNFGAENSPVQYNYTSAMVAANQRVGIAAVQAWNYLYNTEGLANSELNDFTTALNPTLPNWAAKYIRYTSGRQNANAITIECRSDLKGSTTGHMTRDAMKLYAGLIHCFITTWQRDGQTSQIVPNATWYAQRFDTKLTTGISGDPTGGLLDATAWTPLSWDIYRGATSGPYKTFLDIPARCPGVFTINANVLLETNEATADARIVVLQFAWGKSPAGGGTAPGFSESSAYGTVPALGGRVVVPLMMNVLVNAPFLTDDNPLYRLQLRARLQDAGDPVKIRMIRLSVNHSPNLDIYPMPWIVRST